MNVSIYSRKEAKSLIQKGFPVNTAVICFYSPKKTAWAEDRRLNYADHCARVFYVPIPDIDREVLKSWGYTESSFFSQAEELAAYICKAVEEGLDIFCQCDYGQSRSAGCAAAILQYFEGRGIDIFADYRYYPNQLVYNKIFNALQKCGTAAKEKRT